MFIIYLLTFNFITLDQINLIWETNQNFLYFYLLIWLNKERNFKAVLILNELNIK